MSIVAQLAPTFTVIVSPNVPEKTLYWQGFDQYSDCVTSGDFLSKEEFASMTPEERRGYEAAQRCAADTETYAYLSNYNAYADPTTY